MNYTVIPFLDFIPDSFNWGMHRFDGSHTSSQSGSSQIIRRGYRHTLDLNWQKFTVAEAQAISAWAEQMAFRGNKCRITDYSYTPQGEAVGPITFSSNASMGQIEVAGLTPSLAAAFKRGDFMQLATGQLVRCADASVAADTSGNAIVNLTTWLRSIPAAGSAITLVNPTALFEFKQGAYSRDVQAPSQSGMTVSMVEFVP